MHVQRCDYGELAVRERALVDARRAALCGRPHSAFMFRSHWREQLDLFEPFINATISHPTQVSLTRDLACDAVCAVAVEDTVPWQTGVLRRGRAAVQWARQLYPPRANTGTRIHHVFPRTDRGGNETSQLECAW